jgi:murein DD-endopeptidase MepM/ murein hydrolase activator NlpD
MPSVVELFRARPQAVVLAVIAVGIAGCSAEVTRFDDNPFASRAASHEVTRSVATPAPSGRIEQSQLPPPGAIGPAASTGVVGGGTGMASYQPGTAAAADVTGSVQARRQQAGQWSWDGGTAVTVASGETIETIARRHGVPVSAIMQANGLTSFAIRPGQRLVIPRYNASASASAPATPPGASTPAPTAGNPNVHIVAPGETLSKISRRYRKSIPEIARVNNMEPHAQLRIGDRIIIPGLRTASATSKSAIRLTQAQPLATQPPRAPPSAKQPEQAQQMVITNDAPAPTNAALKTTDAAPTFRWPVKGRVIAGFGPKPNGQQNDGINLAVPEGTPIKAAEDGVVAYAGNELRGYGNLVLIRHANGYVTAYAHAKELQVRRGDPVKRGQVIATSGQTGNVDAPQLHFEVRKGPTPLDPMPLLTGG